MPSINHIRQNNRKSPNFAKYVPSSSYAMGIRDIHRSVSMNFNTLLTGELFISLDYQTHDFIFAMKRLYDFYVVRMLVEAMTHELLSIDIVPRFGSWETFTYICHNLSPGDHTLIDPTSSFLLFCWTRNTNVSMHLLIISNCTITLCTTLMPARL